MRIDAYLAAVGLCSSRTEAKNLIDEGAVFIDGRMVVKPSEDYTGSREAVFVKKALRQSRRTEAGGGNLLF